MLAIDEKSRLKAESKAKDKEYESKRTKARLENPELKENVKQFTGPQQVRGGLSPGRPCSAWPLYHGFEYRSFVCVEGKPVRVELWREVKELQDENAVLKVSVRRLRVENDRLKQELEMLKSWPDYGTSVVLDD